MFRAPRRRPSAALVVACIALIAALSGPAVARTVKTLISGSSIKAHSISGDRLKNHTITGTQINLSKLGRVPRAALADVATRANSAGTATNAVNAQNAAALGGVPASSIVNSSSLLRWSFSMHKGDPRHTIGQLGSLIFSATCANDAGKTNAQLQVATSESGAFASTNPDNLPTGSFTLNAGDPPQTVLSQDTAVPNDGNSGAFAAFTPSGNVAIFNTAQTLGLAINTTAADCRFFGFLVNDAG